MTENRYTQIADKAIADVKKIDCTEIQAERDSPSLLKQIAVLSVFGPLGTAFINRSKWFGASTDESVSRLDSCEADKQNRLKTLEGQKAEALKM
jgi:hypothetical protein